MYVWAAASVVLAGFWSRRNWIWNHALQENKSETKWSADIRKKRLKPPTDLTEPQGKLKI